MKGNKLLVRADSGSTIGSGHVMRMLALAEAWLAKGGSVVVMGLLQDSMSARMRGLGIEVVDLHQARGSDADAAATRSLADGEGCGWIVADGYCFGDDWQRQAKAGAARLMVVDDNGENGPYVADWILNVNLHAEERLYAQRAPDTELLLGPRYALLRSEFRNASEIRRASKADATRWLVTMGGADPVDATGAFLAAVANAGEQPVEINVLVGPSNARLPAYEAAASRCRTPVTFASNPADVSRLMAQADLALTAAGGTVWELALMGVPSAVVSLADNQKGLALAMGAMGLAEWLGDAPGDAAGWLRSLVALSKDPARRAGYVEKARLQVDGEGAFRVVDVLRKEL